MNVMITGATGLLGRALMEELSRSRGLDVVGTGLRRAGGSVRPRNSRLDCSDLERLGVGRRTPFGSALSAALAPLRP